jgi:Predicted membrane protein (DUF2306)
MPTLNPSSARFDAALSRLPPSPLPARQAADRWLRRAATAWWAVALLGQGLFAFYVVAFYGAAAWRGDLPAWRQVLSHGHIAGDPLGNAVLALHLAFTVVIIASGLWQLLPPLRRHAPALHRWNGRLYLLSAALLSLGGLVMMWTRGTVGDLSQHLGTSFNALLILACAGLAWRAARARQFEAHKRWALRLVLAVSGVWFFRILLMGWLVAQQGPVGFDPATFRGPVLTAFAWAQALLPLAVLELTLRVQDSGGVAARRAMAVSLALLALLTAAGVAAATAILWWPRF